MLPCPLCAAGLRGENLEKHLAKVHAGAGQTSPEAEAFVWVGPSRRVPVVAFVALAVAILWVVATKSGMIPVSGEAVVVVAGGLGLVFFALLALSETDRLSARLVFDGESLNLSRSLGLRCRSVSLPAELEVGSAWEKWSTAYRVGDDYYWTNQGDRRVGGYLRIFSGSKSITVIASNTSVKEFWSPKGLQIGPKRFRGDIKLDAAEFVVLEYLLASRGMLSLN
jgi:hypothetical protein